jgi:Protein of unknown function (DUF2637)
MNGMGRHNLLNGHRGEDGATAFPVLQVRQLGPMSAWPPLPDDATVVPVPAAIDKKRSFDGDKLRRASMWALASGVAAIAAVVSYSHVYDLGRAHGGSGAAARLLPLSVDMLILVGELMLLHEADKKGRRFALGWVLVWSGILATLAANVTYGYEFGVLGAVIWGWPAYSFILAAGGMVAVVKRGAVRDSDDGSDGGTEAVPNPSPVPSEPAPMEHRETVTPAVTAPVAKPSPRPSRQPSKRTSGRDRATAIIKRDGALTDAEVAKRARVSESTARRARAAAVSTQERKTS